MVHADYGSGNKWFCNTDRPEFEKNDYESSVIGYNDITKIFVANNQGKSLKGLGDHFIGEGLERIGQKAACLKEVHGIEPDSVATFSPEVQEVFSANMDKLIETAPTLVNYATVPEFGSIAMLILIISIIGVMISTRKLNVIK